MNKIKIHNFIELDEDGKGKRNRMSYFDDNGALPDGNYNKDDLEGKWIIIEGKPEIKNNLTYAYRTIDDTTLLKVD